MHKLKHFLVQLQQLQSSIIEVESASVFIISVFCFKRKATIRTRLYQVRANEAAKGQSEGDA